MNFKHLLSCDTIVKKFVSSAVGKIYTFRTEKLRELEAPWFKN